jgi:AraC family transcriptional regulator, regulatory protein of adaptative response / methylated-DNA-[protein]-cysteine methyltransferase
MQAQTMKVEEKEGETGISEKAELVRQICSYIRGAPTSKITLASLGKHFGISQYRLQRIFVEVMGISPRKYLEECRVSILKHRLRRGEPVINALRATGYSSQSWLYEHSRIRLGMTPADYKSGGSGLIIMYATGDSPVGRILVAATQYGICSVNAGNDDKELAAWMRQEYPNAQLVESKKARQFLEGINGYLQGQQAKLPLDVRGTDFQLKVWTALQTIPIGETRSYSDIAQLIGKPKAFRAVANACASNPVPLIVPCHRVIRSDGSLGGYGLGLPRKEKLLELERSITKKR